MLRPIDVARQFGRSAEWLKNLERRGIIPKAQRDPLNGRRVYPIEAVDQIRATLLVREKQRLLATAFVRRIKAEEL